MQKSLYLLLLLLAAATFGCTDQVEKPNNESSGVQLIVKHELPHADSQPYYLAKDAAGNVWFTEYQVARIGKMDTTGFVTEYDVPSYNFGVVISVGPGGSMWFTEGNDVNVIGEITPNREVRELPLPIGACAGEGIAAGLDGNMWFTDPCQNRIARITTEGKVSEFRVLSRDAFVKGIVAGPDDNLWFTETNTGRIGRITPRGEVREFDGPTDSALPSGIVVGPNRRLYAAANNGVWEIDLSGHVENYGDALSADGDVVVLGPQNNLWISHPTNGKIDIFNPRTHMFSKPVQPKISIVGGLTTGSDGRVWFAAQNDNYLGAYRWRPPVGKVAASPAPGHHRH